MENGKIQYSTIFRLILRLICSPLMIGILLITYNLWAIRICIKYVQYGGEISVYKKNDNKTIQDIYSLLKNNPELLTQLETSKIDKV